MPAAFAQSHCTEAARAAALASHSAASLAAATGFREAACLLRSWEALACAATTALLALPLSDPRTLFLLAVGPLAHQGKYTIVLHVSLIFHSWENGRLKWHQMGPQSYVSG